jgi:hypothetical protein
MIQGAPEQNRAAASVRDHGEPILPPLSADPNLKTTQRCITMLIAVLQRVCIEIDTFK